MNPTNPLYADLVEVELVVCIPNIIFFSYCYEYLKLQRYDVVIGADGTNSRIRDEYFKGEEYPFDLVLLAFFLLHPKV